MKPIKTRIQLWYDALMRAKKQTTGCLKDESGRCCLGVACDVYQQNTGKGHWDGSCFIDDECDLPDEVRKWFGFDSPDPILISNEEKKYASVLNDNDNLSFKQIAACVKKTFLENKNVKSSK